MEREVFENPEVAELILKKSVEQNSTHIWT
jgi:hypothetical protein